MKDVVQGNPTILLVEDNDADAQLACKAFVKAAPHFNFKRVILGSTTIAYLAGEGIYADRSRFPWPDLMILDMRLPDVTGEHVLNWIKAHPKMEKLCVMILAGQSRQRRNTPVMETFGNVTICHAEFLKPPSTQLAETMLSLFGQWKNMQKKN